MTPERYQLIKRAFRLALDAPPSEREQLLASFAPGDADLIETVRGLLAADQTPATPLDVPIVGSAFRRRTRALAHAAPR